MKESASILTLVSSLVQPSRTPPGGPDSSPNSRPNRHFRLQWCGKVPVGGHPPRFLYLSLACEESRAILTLRDSRYDLGHTIVVDGSRLRGSSRKGRRSALACMQGV